MKVTLKHLIVLQAVTFVFLSTAYCAGLNNYSVSATSITVRCLHGVTGVNDYTDSAISLLNKRSVISATLLGVGIGASWAPVYFGAGDYPALGLIVGTGGGGLMGFTTSNILVRVQPENGIKGFLLGMGIGSAGGLLSGLAAGVVTFVEEEDFSFPGRTAGISLACLGGAGTGLLSGAVFCCIYGIKVGRYKSEKRGDDLSLYFEPPRIVPVKDTDGKVYMRYDINILSVAF